MYLKKAVEVVSSIIMKTDGGYDNKYDNEFEK